MHRGNRGHDRRRRRIDQGSTRLPFKRVLSRLPFDPRRSILSSCNQFGIFLSFSVSPQSPHNVQLTEINDVSTPRSTSSSPGGVPTSYIKRVYGYFSDDPLRHPFLLMNELDLIRACEGPATTLPTDRDFQASLSRFIPRGVAIDKVLLPRDFTQLRCRDDAPNQFRFNKVTVCSAGLPGGSLDCSFVRQLDYALIAPLDFFLLLRTFPNLRTLNVITSDLLVPPCDPSERYLHVSVLFSPSSPLEALSIIDKTCPFTISWFQQSNSTLRSFSTSSKYFTDEVFYRLMRYFTGLRDLDILQTPVSAAALRELFVSNSYSIPRKCRLRTLGVRADVIEEALRPGRHLSRFRRVYLKPLLTLRTLKVSFFAELKWDLGSMMMGEVYAGTIQEQRREKLFSDDDNYEFKEENSLLFFLANQCPNIQTLIVNGPLEDSDALMNFLDLRSFETNESLHPQLISGLVGCRKLHSLRLRLFGATFPSRLYEILEGEEDHFNVGSGSGKTLRYVDVELDDYDYNEDGESELVRELVKLMEYPSMKYLRVSTGGAFPGREEGGGILRRGGDLEEAFLRSGMLEMELDDARRRETILKDVTL